MTAALVHELLPAPDPVQACEALAGLPYRLLFDSASLDARLGRYSFLSADPVALVRSKRGLTELWTGSGGSLRDGATPIDIVRGWLAPFKAAAIEGLPPFQGGAAGYIGYEFGRVLEPVPPTRFDDLDLPDIVFGLYDWVIAWDHTQGRAWLISTGIPHVDDAVRKRYAEERRASVVTWLSGTVSPRAVSPTTGPRGTAPSLPAWPAATAAAPSFPVVDGRVDSPSALRSSFTRGDYLVAVDRVREYISAGDVFQVNLSQRFEATLRDSPWQLYLRLRGRNAAPFAAFLDFPEGVVLSASPERFLRVTPDGWAETRPIKGTRPRGFGPEHDLHLGRELMESAKDQAENMMIVDLMRNDLSRVCRPGSVRVSELFALEHYATVHHLVSTVVGHLDERHDALSLLLSAFPGGSVTGAPKIRAREIIAELEPSERGVYCGSIGYMSLTGALDTSIAIRTAVVQGSRVTFSAGGGITFDSDPEQEYRETLDKARGMIDAAHANHGVGARQS